MKRKVFILTMSFTILIGLSIFAFSMAKEYFRAEFMGIGKAEKKWGITKFDAKKFRELSSNPIKRAPMAVYIVKKGLFIGARITEVREQLGDPDGYFFSDTIIGYEIQPKAHDGKEAWQLVFIRDNNLEKVEKVRIHKKCCYKQPFWAK